MIVKNLRKSRENLELKQKDVAEFLGIHLSTVSGWETGKDTITIKRLVEYANEYSLSLDSLFGLIAKNEEYNPLDLDLEVLATNLTNLRLAHNFTQVTIAKMLNTSQSAYSHYENAIYIIPTSFLFGLTKIYKKSFSIDKLFGRVKKNSK